MTATVTATATATDLGGEAGSPCGRAKSAHEQDPSGPSPAGVALRASLTVAILVITWPTTRDVWTSIAELGKVGLGPLLAMTGLVTASLVCSWQTMRIALPRLGWGSAAGAQLASNSIAALVPGGPAAGALVQQRMLSRSGVDPLEAGAATAVIGLANVALMAMLPVLALPSMLGRDGVPLLFWAVALGALTVGTALSAAVLWIMGPRHPVPNLIARAGRQIRQIRPGLDVAPFVERCHRARTDLRVSLKGRTGAAVAASLGNWLFDLSALGVALAALDAAIPPAYLIVVFVGAKLLRMVPLTPGGLGLVEAGLPGLLVLAGVDPPAAALATVTYRLVEHWLPLSLGAPAYLIHWRHFGRGSSGRHCPATS